MKVSIVIPVHNVEEYIERCINSVMVQTYTDIECILVDDGCTDHSMDICNALIANYDGAISFHVIKHEKAQGPSGARNSGTDAASGKFIFYLDSDDEISKDCIELLLAKTLYYPDVEIIQGAIYSEKNQDYYSLDRYKDVEYVDDNNWICKEFFMVERNFPVDVWNKLIRRDFLTKNKIRFKDGIIHEDQLWSYYVIKALNKMCFVHKATYFHYAVPNSIMTTLSFQRSNYSWLVILETIVPSMCNPYQKLQLRKYLLEFLDRYNFMRSSKLMYKFIRKSMACREIKLAFALYLFNTFHGASIKQWLFTYCRTEESRNIVKEIVYDLRAWSSKKFKLFRYFSL